MLRTPSKRRLAVASTAVAIAAGCILNYEALLFSAYPKLLAKAQSWSVERSPRVETQDELEAAVRAEQRKLNCTGKAIIPIFSQDSNTVSAAYKLSDGTYPLVFSKRGMNLSTVKHETYHACKGHLDTKATFNRYLFVHESAATLHQLFDW